jgi:MerR family transcriptional regulator, light-induced transcriptional regulator
MSHEPLKNSFLSAQLAGKRAEAVRIVTDALDQGVPAREVQLRVIAEAQREIGRLWELNQVTIAQEHLATAIAHLALTRLYDFGQL